MIEWVQQFFAGAMARSVIRKLMTMASGVLLGLNIPAATVDSFTNSATDILIALIPYLLAQLWSVAEKRIAAK